MSVNLPPALNFQTWQQWILAAAIEKPTSSTEHAWICYTYNEKREQCMSVLSPEEYRKLSSKNSFWEKHCEKIPLIELLNITQTLATPTIEAGIVSDLTDSLWGTACTVFSGDAFSSDMKADTLVLTWLQDWQQKKTMKEDEIRHFPRFIQALENMCLRSEAKREALKAKGVWGSFFLFIYLYFNKIPETKNLKIASPQKQPEYDLPIHEIKKKLCELGMNQIKNRILLNMEDFEENFQDDLVQTKEEYKKKNWKDEIQDPNDVKKKWLLYYAEDKISKGKVSELGNEQRVRIQTLNKLWEEFKNYSKSIINTSQSEEPLSRSDQPQALQLISQ
ncbi:MAG TPA: hypothetical protein VHK67_05545 [Rhabdochlamydiaceae bacterium]|jgi:hypothetical protein|nr:hypothetical protein [Rhabdochlamydiaceae bacterium]